MAKMKITMPDSFTKKLETLGSNTDKVITAVLEAGSEVLEAEVKRNLQAVVGKNTKEPSKSTGQLVASLGSSKVRQAKDGSFDIKVGFAENRSDGESNAKIANILEYGSSKQNAKPFLKPAMRSAKEPVISAMVAALDKEVSKV